MITVLYDNSINEIKDFDANYFGKYVYFIARRQLVKRNIGKKLVVHRVH